MSPTRLRARHWYEQRLDPKVFEERMESIGRPVRRIGGCVLVESGIACRSPYAPYPRIVDDKE